VDSVTVLTWNLQGSKGVDVMAVADVVQASGADIALLQEIQRGQLGRLRRALGWEARWTFKHWPVVSRPEGMAVATPHRLGRTTSFVVHPTWPWSWQRRVALDATVLADGRPWRAINVHLSPPHAGEGRTQEIARVLERAGVAPPIVAGDVNDRPGGPAVAVLAEAGWRDAWRAAHPDQSVDAAESTDDIVDPGATNWTPGLRAGRAPTQRLDVVFLPASWEVLAADVVTEPPAHLAELSDHLPLVVTARRVHQ